MLLKRVAALVASASMALAATAAIAPSVAAQTETVTETTSVSYTCRGTDTGLAPGSPRDVTVTYPESVAPGEVFTIQLQPGVMRVNDRNHARFTYDIALPDNANLVGYNLTGGQQNLGGTPALVRVDSETKVNQVDGDALRIWGGASARWGTNSGTGNSGGLTVSSGRDFRFPGVSMTFRAPVVPGENVHVGLAGVGPNNSPAGAQLMYSSRTTPFLGIGARDYQNECAASSNAAQLTTTSVADVDPVTLDSTTRIVGGDRIADSSIPVTLRAQVAAQYATPAEIAQGEVVFRDVDTGDEIARANPDAEGFAQIEHQFDRIADDTPDVPVNIVAEYTGVEGNIESSSDSMVLTLTPKPVVQWTSDFAVRTTIGELTEESLPVTIDATFERPGLEYPEGTLVQLYRDGVAIGEPVPMPETVTTLTWEDQVPRADRNATHRYTVELETIRVEYDQWTGSTARPAAVIVRGTEATVPEPEEPGPLETGSLEIGALLTDLVGYDVAPLSAVLSSDSGPAGS